MDKFMEKCNLPKLMPEETERINNLRTDKENG